MPLPRIVFVGGEENRARGFIDSFDSQHFEVALSELPIQFRFGGQRILLIEAVEIQMRVPIAPARPLKMVARLQDSKVVVDVDPCPRACFSEHPGRLPGLGIDKVQIHFVLVAI